MGYSETLWVNSFYGFAYIGLVFALIPDSLSYSYTSLWEQPKSQIQKVSASGVRGAGSFGSASEPKMNYS